MVEHRHISTVEYVICDPDADKTHAKAVAEHIGAKLVSHTDGFAHAHPVLHLTKRGLAIERGEMSLLPDYAPMVCRLTPGKLQSELVVRAAKHKASDKEPLAIDATAGLGEDALLLAAYGYQVRLYERDTVIAALLRDCIHRSRNVPELKKAAGRMEVFEQDSIDAMQRLESRAEVIYLDPMFPERKKSAAVKKKFQLIHTIEPAAMDEEALLSAAIDARPRKIIIKRPLKGEQLGDVKPSYSIAGKAVRFDCIVFA